MGWHWVKPKGKGVGGNSPHKVQPENQRIVKLVEQIFETLLISFKVVATNSSLPCLHLPGNLLGPISDNCC